MRYMAWSKRFWVCVAVVAGIMAVCHYVVLPGCVSFLIGVPGVDGWGLAIWCGLFWDAVFIGGVLLLLALFGIEAYRHYREPR